MPRMRPFQVAQSHILPNGIGLESMRRSISAASRRVWRSSLGEAREGLRENADRTAPIRIRTTSNARETDAQMIVMVGIGVEAGASPRRLSAPLNWACISATR